MAIANTQVAFDNLFWLFTYLAIAVAVVVYGMLAYYVIRYREKNGTPDPKDAPILGRLPVPRGHKKSVIITLSLSTIILSVLIIGSFGSIDTILSTPAPCSIPISGNVAYNCSVLVTGHRFYWEFTYPGFVNNPITGTADCQQATCLFAVPVGYNIRVNVTSDDVFHNFGIIAFAIKADAYPGHINDIWFNADRTGNYTIQCYELCGPGHALMIATLDVMPLAQFVTWYNTTIVH
jgi:cytochrome c oxidase subunit II